MSHLVVKVCHQGEMKRVALPLSISLADLRHKLASLFSLPTGTPVVLKYLDDENDLITLSEEEELQEAVRLAQRSNLVLRVHMFLPNQPIPASDFRANRGSVGVRSDAVPSLLSSQLPLFASAIGASSSSSATGVPAPISLSVIVIEQHHNGLIAQRTATLSSATSALVEKNAAEVTLRTQLQSDRTAGVVEDLARQTSERVEKMTPNAATSQLSEQTADNCETVAQSTSDKVAALSEAVSVEMSKHAEKAAQTNPQHAELDRRWAIIASDTAARVNELSATLVQRLMTL